MAWQNSIRISRSMFSGSVFLIYIEMSNERSNVLQEIFMPTERTVSGCVWPLCLIKGLMKGHFVSWKRLCPFRGCDSNWTRLKRGCTRELTVGGPGVTWGSPIWLKFSPVVQNELKIIGTNFFKIFFQKFRDFGQKPPKIAKDWFFWLAFFSRGN